MSELHIEPDEDVYEGKLYGWRWFAVVHGLWIVVPPMFVTKRTRDNNRVALSAARTGERYFDLLSDYYAALDLINWNEADQPPNYQRQQDEGVFVIPKGHSSGFHLFSNYKSALGYAVVPYDLKKSGVPLPCWHGDLNVPAEMQDHVIGSEYLSLRVTPILAFVEASGAIVEHEKGYRAHLLRLVSLYSEGRASKRQALASRIGWPGKIQRFKKLRGIKNPTEDQLRRLEL